MKIEVGVKTNKRRLLGRFFLLPFFPFFLHFFSSPPNPQLISNKDMSGRGKVSFLPSPHTNNGYSSSPTREEKDSARVEPSVTARSYETTSRVSPSPLSVDWPVVVVSRFVVAACCFLTSIAWLNSGHQQRISGLIYEETRGVLKVFLESEFH